MPGLLRKGVQPRLRRKERELSAWSGPTLVMNSARRAMIAMIHRLGVATGRSAELGFAQSQSTPPLLHSPRRQGDALSTALKLKKNKKHSTRRAPDCRCQKFALPPAQSTYYYYIVPIRHDSEAFAFCGPGPARKCKIIERATIRTTVFTTHRSSPSTSPLRYNAAVATSAP